MAIIGNRYGGNSARQDYAFDNKPEAFKPDDLVGVVYESLQRLRKTSDNLSSDLGKITSQPFCKEDAMAEEKKETSPINFDYVWGSVPDVLNEASARVIRFRLTIKDTIYKRNVEEKSCEKEEVLKEENFIETVDNALQRLDTVISLLEETIRELKGIEEITDPLSTQPIKSNLNFCFLWGSLAPTIDAYIARINDARTRMNSILFSMSEDVYNSKKL